MKLRVLEPEDMDDPHLDPADHRLALAGLTRLNRISFASQAIWRVLEREYLAAATSQGDWPAWVLLDIATGGGDLPVSLAEKARRKGFDWRVAGLDVSPTALEFAARKADAAGVDVQWLRLDVTREALPACDWVISSLFLHHLDDETLVDVLRRMAAAARGGILIDDLERTALNRGLVWLGAHLLSSSKIVHRDSDRSVRASFTLAEMAALASRAELGSVHIKSRFPARFQMRWKR